MICTQKKTGHHHFYWGYEEENGPKHWAEHFPAARDGKEQSPIDIKLNSVETLGGSQTERIVVSYKSSTCILFNNEHTVEWSLENAGHVTYKEKKYDLLQFHFHIPSEHKFDGSAADIELHFVHKNEETDELLVIGHLFRIGNADQFVTNITQLDPPVMGAEIELQYKIETELIGHDKYEYVHYNGSLTTPPCTEGVLWFVSKTMKTLSQRQWDWFRSSINFDNARPVCELHSRKLVSRNARQSI